MTERPYLGFGLGLRTEHYETILAEKPNGIDWFEIISENFMVDGGKPLVNLDKIRANYPIVMHGVSLSVAGGHPLDFDYLKRLKKLIHRVQPEWVSDHLAWTRGNAHNLHDLLPIPYTEETLQHTVERVKRVQDFLGRQILLENPSTYLAFTNSDIPEHDYLNALCERADCLLMLDINNVFVSCENNGGCPYEYLSAIKPDRVWQHHLAGHTHSYAGKILIDTHDMPVCHAVWDLYTHAVKCFGKVSTMIERDDNIPKLSDLIEELNIARQVQQQALNAK